MGILTYTVAWWIAGAKRWLNPEAAKALAIAIVGVCVVVGAVLLYGAGGSSGAAKRDAAWLTRFNAGMASVYQRRTAQAERAAQAASVERERYESERDDAIERVAKLERDLAAMKDNPIVFTRDERRAVMP